MRPRRLYIDTKTHKPYYLIKGEKVFIKIPKKMTMNQLQKVNIKNIIKIGTVKRVKRRTGKRVKGKFTEKITQGMTTNGEIQSTTSKLGLPTYLFQEQKKIPELAIAGRKPQLMLMNGSTTLPKAELISIPNANPIITEMPETNELPMAIPLLTNEPEFVTYMEPEPKEKEKQPKKKEKELKKPVISGANLDSIVNDFRIRYPSVEKNKEGHVAFLKYFESPEVQKLYINKVKVSDRNPPSYEQFKRAYRDYGYRDYGKGNNSDSDDEGLYDNEIEKIAKKRMKHFVPCIASDQTSDLLQYVKRGDKEFSFVINTNPSKSNGSGKDGYPVGHWTCVFIDNRDDYPSCEFFDPLVQGKIPKAVVNIMRKIAVKMNPEKMFKYKQNMIRRQNFMTSHCGQFCIQFLENRMNGESFSEASGYDEYLKNHQPIDDSSEGEEDLEKVLPKYKSYI